MSSAARSQYLSSAYAVHDVHGWEIGPRDDWAPVPELEEGARAMPSARTLQRPQFRANDAGRIRLPRSSRDQAFLVGAPGHTWSRVEVPASCHEEFPVELEAGADLVLTLPGWHTLKCPALFCMRQVGDGNRRVRWLPAPGRTSLHGFTPMLDPSETVRLVGLPLETLRFGVGELIEGDTGQVLAVGIIEVLAGRENRLRIPVPDPGKAEGMSLRGTIHVPPGYEGVDEPWVGWLYGEMGNRKTRKRRGFLRLAPGFPNVGDFTSDPLPEGRWILRLEPVGCRFPIDVIPGMAPLRLEVPPAVRVKVHARCAETDEPISGAWVRHTPRSESRVPNSTWKYASPGVKPGEYWSVCREGLVEFDASARGYRRQSRKISVEAGDIRSIEFRLLRAASFRLSLHRGALPVPVEGMLLRYAPKERPNHNTTRVCFGEDEVCGGLAPGVWIVKPGKLKGYRKPEPKEVEVRVGEAAPIVFDLEPDA